MTSLSATAHEYILVVVAKDRSCARLHGFEPEEKITRRYNKKDHRGKLFREIDLRKTGDADRRSDRPDMYYYFYYEKTTGALTCSREKLEGRNEVEIIPTREDGVEGRWRWGIEQPVSESMSYRHGLCLIARYGGIRARLLGR